MPRRQLFLPNIRDSAILQAMRSIPREEFVPGQLRSRALENRPLPIGYGQTISQPLVVAEMTEALQPEPHHRVLDVGTGNGYQAAVLAELVDQVYSVEIVEPLASAAADRLERLGYNNIEVKVGDGSLGWPGHAPFDGIVCAAAPLRIPQSLIEQLAAGGRLVIPVGGTDQQLLALEKDSQGRVHQQRIASVAFVPMTGAACQSSS